MAESRVRVLAPERAPGSTSALPTGPALEPGAEPAPTTASLPAAASRGRRRTAPRQVAAAAPLVSIAIFLTLAAAPMVAATAALWAVGSALIALARIALAAQTGQALNNSDIPDSLRTLETAARIGFLAIGYLALIFALMTLMAGLFGRGWGRLFILPGALFSATALGLLCLGAVLVASLASHLPIPPAWLIPLALYALVDAVLVSGALVDVRLTRTPTASGRRRAIRLAPTSRARQKRS
jgi:hypothetical protein